MIIFPVAMGNACVSQNIITTATINAKGRINVSAKRSAKNFEGISFPFLRGISFFIFGIYLFVTTIMWNY